MALAVGAAGLSLAVVGAASFRPFAAPEVGYVPDAHAEITVSAPVDVGETERRVVQPTVAEPSRKTPKLAPPVRLELPSLGLSAEVVPVAVDGDGALEVPANPDVLGWWSSGARPGQGQGSILIDGHIDSATEGLGTFVRLRELEPGDPVLTQSASGDVHQYRVTGRRQYAKAALPADEVFSQVVHERLVLITCGGHFDANAGGYADNVVVFAEPDASSI